MPRSFPRALAFLGGIAISVMEFEGTEVLLNKLLINGFGFP